MKLLILVTFEFYNFRKLWGQKKGGLVSNPIYIIIYRDTLVIWGRPGRDNGWEYQNSSACPFDIHASSPINWIYVIYILDYVYNISRVIPHLNILYWS